jgi:hypothetical protein
MVELRRYARSLQEAIGKEYSPKKNSADSIDESHWLELVVKELNKMSVECARELEKETGKYPKPGYPNGQSLEQAPPTRLLSLTLILSYWLGWVNNEKNMDASVPQPFKAWTRTEEAYMAGRELSKRKERP